MITYPTRPETVRRVTHPARFSKGMLAIFAKYLKVGWKILDPMAGSCKIGRLKHFDPTLTIVANEIEREWATGEGIDALFHADAAHMDWASDGEFDALVSSVTYGNRMADKYTDATKRITYRAFLGHDLHPANTGSLQWGERYRAKHVEIYAECLRVLRAGGLFIVNVSNHIRDGKEIDVAGWHKQTLESFGLSLVAEHEIQTARARYGKNFDKRVGCEMIYVFEKA